MKKRILSVLLVLAMVMALVPMFAVAGTAATTRVTSWYEDNADTKKYTITTAGELLGFSDLLASGMTFKDWEITLGNDIDLNRDWVASATPPTDTWADTTGKTFMGIFDGNEKTVSGIYLSAASGATASATGIFGGYGTGATVKDLVVINSFVQGGKRLGSIFGQAYEGTVTVENVYCDAYVKSSGDSSETNPFTLVGGLVGYLGGKTPTVNIKNSVFSGTVEGTNKARVLGGIVGYAIAGTHVIENCAFYGKVTGDNLILGGILARVDNSATDLTIKNCISAGMVYYSTDTAYSGAFYANTSGVTSSQIKMENCYYTSNMYYAGGSTSRHIGSSNKAVEPTALTENVAMYTLVDDAVLVGTLENVSKLKGFTATEAGYPRPSTMIEMTASIYDGTAAWYDAEKTSFELTYPNELLGFAELLAAGNTFEGKTVTLGADVDLNESWTVGDGVPANKWADVGGKTFSGTFDGQGHEISGVYLKTSAQNAGMFGRVIGTSTATASVSNLSVTNSYVENTANHVAGIAGEAQYALFENLYVDIDVVGADQYVGGIANNVSRTVTLRNCVCAGNVSGNQKVGGLVGYVPWADLTIDKCAFYGNITATDNSAGIIMGYAYYTTNNTHKLNISSCIAAGTFTYGPSGSDGRFGAILGSTKSGWTITVTDTYYTPFTANGENVDCPYATASGYDTKPADGAAGLTYKVNADFQGINAITPDGFVSMPEGYTMPMGVVNMVAKMNATSTFATAFDGYQESVDTSKCDIRLIGLVNLLGEEGSTLSDEYRGFGFDVTLISATGNEWTNEVEGEIPVITTVYTSVQEHGKETPTTAAELGADYIFVATVSPIPTNVGVITLVVKTFHDDFDGNRVYDDVMVIKYDTTVAE